MSDIVKEYSARGSLKQFRLADIVSFQCRYCAAEKTSKLVAIYEGDWSNPICNGCYGNVLSKIPLAKKMKPYPAMRQEYGPFLQVIPGGLPSLGKRR
jgi:hypothetical protein